MRRDDLLDWLGRRLGLSWVHGTGGAPAEPVPAGGGTDTTLPAQAAHPLLRCLPDAATREALLHSLRLGHVRGVERHLAQLLRAQPGCAPYVAQARAMLSEFQLDALERWLTDDPTPPPPGLPA